jgi:hypothetical protein
LELWTTWVITRRKPPDSLKLLLIWRCLLLQEKYKRQEHWSEIAHIPVIEIDGEVTLWAMVV